MVKFKYNLYKLEINLKYQHDLQFVTHIIMLRVGRLQPTRARHELGYTVGGPMPISCQAGLRVLGPRAVPGMALDIMGPAWAGPSTAHTSNISPT